MSAKWKSLEILFWPWRQVILNTFKKGLRTECNRGKTRLAAFSFCIHSHRAPLGGSNVHGLIIKHRLDAQICAKRGRGDKRCVEEWKQKLHSLSTYHVPDNHGGWGGRHVPSWKGNVEGNWTIQTLRVKPQDPTYIMLFKPHHSLFCGWQTEPMLREDKYAVLWTPSSWLVATMI